jgi:hypothetical protein
VAGGSRSLTSGEEIFAKSFNPGQNAIVLNGIPPLLGTPSQTIRCLKGSRLTIYP